MAPQSELTKRRKALLGCGSLVFALLICELLLRIFRTAPAVASTPVPQQP